MAASIVRYDYPTTQSAMELFSDNTIMMKFGRATVNLPENTTETHWVYESFKKLKQLRPQVRFNVLIDLSTIDSSEYNSDESNALYRKMLADVAIGKVAIFGISPGWELFIDLFRFYFKNKIRTFATESKARDWLSRYAVAN